MPKTPVFDIGDTLLPDDRLMNEAVEEVLMGRGYSRNQVPRFPIYEYSIFKPEELQDFLMSNNLEASPVKIAERYRKKARKWFAESKVPELLLKCDSEFGKIGFISDNAVEQKEFFQDVLRKHYIDYRGYVVSEEAGVEKPDQGIFQVFLDIRDERGENFVYLGNNARVDQGCKKVGIEFVWVKEFNTFGSEWTGKTMESLDIDSIRKVLSDR